MEQHIREKINMNYSPHYLRIDNDSGLHQGSNGRSHYKVLLVSDVFAGLSAVERHRQIYRCLGRDVMDNIHALQLTVWTIDQWEENCKKNAMPSSRCQHS